MRLLRFPFSTLGGLRATARNDVLSLLFLALATNTPCMAQHSRVVYLLPVGKVEKGLLKELAQSLRDKLGVTAEVGEAVEISKAAFDQGRNQYNSTRVLQGLETTRPRISKGRVTLSQLLAVTEVDLFVPNLNFVFGEALPTKDMAIISLCRLRQEFYGKPADTTLLMERTVKEAVHELGHVWGMRHCPDSHCVMFFSNSLLDTDRKSDTFCKRCKGLLKDNVQE
ncbi:MAG: archaemetzincin family Zn-dependent metalloprotease [Candidatus Brocadiaceae bacterium]|nr:archaemetzincin family Zn-dependent metalloprotease [Candidatus Brocadiaceae bacterium]